MNTTDNHVEPDLEIVPEAEPDTTSTDVEKDAIHVRLNRRIRRAFSKISKVEVPEGTKRFLMVALVATLVLLAFCLIYVVSMMIGILLFSISPILYWIYVILLWVGFIYLCYRQYGA